MEKYTPLFYTAKGDKVKFIYFSGFEYKAVSAENYGGLRDFVMCSKAISCEDIYDKCKELNQPIEDSKTVAKAQQDQFNEKYHWSLVQQVIKTDGTVHLSWTTDSDDVSTKMREEFPFIHD